MVSVCGMAWRTQAGLVKKAPSLHKPPGNEADSALLLLSYVSALVAMPWLVVRLVTELVPPLASRIATAALLLE